jgi:hypothetical protein
MECLVALMVAGLILTIVTVWRSSRRFRLLEEARARHARAQHVLDKHRGIGVPGGMVPERCVACHEPYPCPSYTQAWSIVNGI